MDGVMLGGRKFVDSQALDCGRTASTLHNACCIGTAGFQRRPPMYLTKSLGLRLIGDDACSAQSHSTAPRSAALAFVSALRNRTGVRPLLGKWWMSRLGSYQSSF